MKRKTWKKTMSMTMMAAMLLSLTPASAMAAENKTVKNDWVTMEFNGYVGENVGKIFKGTANPKGIDLSSYDFEYDWVEEELSYKRFSESESIDLDKLYVVGENSSLNLSKTNPGQNENGSFHVSVYLLDEKDNLAYTVEYLGIETIVSEKPSKILQFDNIMPTDSLKGNHFFADYSGKFDVEDLLYVVEVYEDGMYNCKPELYGFQVGDDAPATGYDEVSFTHAKGTALEIPVDGETVVFEAYNIEGNNYVKLRDVAMAMDGTDAKFNVTWDNTKKAIDMITGASYDAVGTELPVQKQLEKEEAEDKEREKQGYFTSMDMGLTRFYPESQNASANTAKIYLDGEAVEMKAYNIGGNTYFKLRDLGQVLDFNVAWNAATQTVTLDTSQGYDA